MSTTNLLLGTGALALAGQFMLSAVLPSQPPIEVHTLTYSEGVVHQKRTVTAEGDFFPAQWQAAIYSVDTGEPVTFCTGEGFWNYSSGYKIAAIPLGEWVGSNKCTVEALREVGGEFRPIASWHWGDEFTIHKGEVFRP